MMISTKHFDLSLIYTTLVLLCLSFLVACEKPSDDARDSSTNTNTSTSEQTTSNLVELKLTLPQARFTETPKNLPGGLTEIEPPRTTPRPSLKVAPGLSNVALGKSVTASDDFPVTPVEPAVVTDGDKEAMEGRSLVLGPGQQWVTIDLGKPYEIHAIAIWRDHGTPKIYYDVIIELAGEDDADFIEGQIIFNNDRDGSSGRGVGKDLPYWESYEGKLIPVDKKVARYVRIYSSQSTHNQFNAINEVEVYGKVAGDEQ